MCIRDRSRIAHSNDKKNKTRSILIMMSICLTTMLLVIISTVGNGVIDVYKRQVYGSQGDAEAYRLVYGRLPGFFHAAQKG